ncbi:PucR-like helix-turn-helix protein [Micromonospora sp. M71_S20]|uniref:helix-turn-helix domain-containing protein n=1 Tax=Micromonospora sp. M71_S20 TaxID=592872 RepID=UPI000F29E2B0|nr:helix-turn-helix domain-containing protein [Micromonospora sp. M71_S20]RLK22711.1 PucR-like helix-turn-helix protein [Micromonospora sp. M71_S20]
MRTEPDRSRARGRPPRPCPERAEAVVAMTRLAAGPDPVAAVLGELARRSAATVALIGVDGTVLSVRAGRHPLAPAVLTVAARAVPDLHARGTPAAVRGGDGAPTVHLVALGAGEPGNGADCDPDGATDPPPWLAAVDPVASVPGDLLADAARLLGLCWRLDRSERARRRVAAGDGRGREAVLHLLMVGDVAPARRVAAALRPHLPDVARVCVVECAPGRRGAAAGQVTRALGGRAWVVPCPVRSRHLIALVPQHGGAPGARRADADAAGRLISQWVPDTRVGVSEPVPLHRTAVGYEQAFHALAVARSRPEGHCRFDRPADLRSALGPAGSDWASTLLAPCLSYRPGRRTDPDGQELLATLGSWLAFDGAAHRHLRIHRNTLAARLALLRDRLALDLSRVSDQSVAWLALRLLAPTAPEDDGDDGDGPGGTRGDRPGGTRGDGPRGTPGNQPGGTRGDGPRGVRGDGLGGAPGGDEDIRWHGLDRLLAAPALRLWAHDQVALLGTDGTAVGLATVRAWLRADGRLPGTAAALGISVSAVRKRLARAEQALGRSLLRGPSARHELWLALRILDSRPD